MIESDGVSTLEWVEKIRLDVNGSLKKIYFLYREQFEFWIVQSFNIQSEDVKDIYQDSILAMYENIKKGKFTGELCSLKTYLFAIGRNITLHHLKKSSTRKEYSHDEAVLNEVIIKESVDDFFEKISIKEQTERAKIIKDKLSLLKKPCREIILLYYFEQLNMQEISQKLAYKNTNVAKAQKYRCMSKLLNLFSKL